mmetsp:Transcript_21013/g.52870  ORF Transcript_21013/g.52870 Transcript_21013/m.52870 type:complete len:281 (-) Transcript_21013:1948-2790(-)
MGSRRMGHRKTSGVPSGAATRRRRDAGEAQEAALLGSIQALPSRARAARRGSTWKRRSGRCRARRSVHASARPARADALGAGQGPARGSSRPAGRAPDAPLGPIDACTSATSPPASTRPVSSCSSSTPRLYTSLAGVRLLEPSRYCGSVCAELLHGGTGGAAWGGGAGAIIARNGDSRLAAGARPAGGAGVEAGAGWWVSPAARRSGRRPPCARRACSAPSSSTLPGCRAPCTLRRDASAASPSATSDACRRRVGHGRPRPLSAAPGANQSARLPRGAAS